MDFGEGSTRRWSLDSGRWVDSEPRPAALMEPDRIPCRLGPFIAFKRLVDGAFATVTSPVVRRLEQHRLSDLKKIHDEQNWRRRWYGRPDAIRSGMDRRTAEDAAATLLDIAELRTTDTDPRRVDALLADDCDVASKKSEEEALVNAMLAFGGASYFSPDVGDRLPSSAALYRLARSPKQPRWLSMEWFKHSQYSPVQIEAIDALDPVKWRAAFEDLLHTSLGRQVPCLHFLESQMISNTSAPSGLCWTLALLFTGALPSIPLSDRHTNGLVAISSKMLGRTQRHDQSGIREIVREIQVLDDVPVMPRPSLPVTFRPRMRPLLSTEMRDMGPDAMPNYKPN